MDSSLKTTHQLRLGRRRPLLKVHPSQSSGFMIQGKIALSDVCIKTIRLELAATKGAREKTACVAMWFQIDKEGALERSFGEDHWVLMDE